MSFIFDLLFEFDGDVFRNDVLEFFYIGLYEWEMELEFENLIELYRQICDFDDWLMEIGSFIRIGFSDEEVELVQELNIWMLFILFNIVFFFESFNFIFCLYDFVQRGFGMLFLNILLLNLDDELSVKFVCVVVFVIIC